MALGTGRRRLNALLQPLAAAAAALLLLATAQLPGAAAAAASRTKYEEEVGLSARPAPGKVAYGIMVYQRANKTVAEVQAQFERLFDAVYDEGFTYIVHVDIKSDRALIDGIAAYVEEHKGAHLIPSVSVSWAGVTVVERTLALMQEALELDPEWEYFVNIGQEDYPLERPQVIREYLAEQATPGTNFIYCWDINGHDFFGQWEHHHGRVQRVFVDMFDGRTVEMESVVRPPPTEFKFYKSLQQTVLSRAFVRFAVESAASRRLLLHLATSQAPDEIFFPTLLHLPEAAPHRERATCNGTLHFSHWIRPGGSWHPEYLTPLHLPLILEKLKGKQAFWARKFDVEKGGRALMDALDYRRLCGHALEGEADLDWAPAVIFARNMSDKIVLREPQPLGVLLRREGVVEMEKGAGRRLAGDNCAYKELRLGGELVRGDDLLGQLDKARRKQDAEAIMAFIAMVERHMQAHAHAYNSPYLEEQRRKLAAEYVRQEAMHQAISRQLPTGTTPARVKAEAADAAMVPEPAAAKRASVEAAAGAGAGSPF